MSVVYSRGTHPVRAWCALLLGVGALLAGCHGNRLFVPGTPVLTMGQSVNTSDFASYIIIIDDITLTESDGSVVTLLGVPETVDLARLSTLEELVEAPAVPAATYISASITVNYGSALIYPIVNGQPVAATVVGPSGSALTTLAITVTFDPNNPLVITNNQSTRLRFVFDLAASNSINTASSTPVVKVQPFALMAPAPVDATVMRARGLFVTTQSLTNGFYMNLRPFYDLVSALGAVIVNIDAQTYFNINGVTYTGAAGLQVLQSQPVDTALAVYGRLNDLSTITPTFNATAVYAGTSLESELGDYLNGTVASRSDGTLQLLGAIHFLPTGGTSFVTSLPVTLGNNTIVSEDGVPAAGLSQASVSVGQQITVYGQATNNSSTGAIESLDATAGQVRLGQTRLWGTLNSASSASASLDLLTIGGFPPSAFDFAGTGTPPATPSAYQLNTGALNESTVAPGTLLAVDGVVSPFGSAPPDFTAAAITPGSSMQQQLVFEWANGAAANSPFSSLTHTGFVVDVRNVDLSSIRYIRTGAATLDINSLPGGKSPLITTVGADQSELQLAVGSSADAAGVSVFSSPVEFYTAIAKALSGGTNRVYRLVAYGQYNSSTNTFVASTIYVALQEST